MVGHDVTGDYDEYDDHDVGHDVSGEDEMSPNRHRWGGGDDDDGGGASSGCGGGKKKIIQTRLLVVDIYSDWAGPCVAIRVSPYIVN